MPMTFNAFEGSLPKWDGQEELRTTGEDKSEGESSEALKFGVAGERCRVGFDENGALPCVGGEADIIDGRL